MSLDGLRRLSRNFGLGAVRFGLSPEAGSPLARGAEASCDLAGRRSLLDAQGDDRLQSPAASGLEPMQQLCQLVTSLHDIDRYQRVQPGRTSGDLPAEFADCFAMPEQSATQLIGDLGHLLVETDHFGDRSRHLIPSQDGRSSHTPPSCSYARSAPALVAALSDAGSLVVATARRCLRCLSHRQRFLGRCPPILLGRAP